MKTNRRNFIGGLTAAAGVAAVGGCASSKYGFHCARAAFRGQRLKFGVIGAGGKGFTDWTNMLAHGEVPAAICDVDRGNIDRALAYLREKGFGTADVRTYTDYRRMFDDQAKLGLDVVNISTPDHMHAAQAITAMKSGVHCYVQKPLVKTLWEAEYFRQVAEATGCVTQMGNQGSAAHGFRRHVELLQQGVIGDVTEVYVWTNRPIWFQGLLARRFAAGRVAAAPGTLDWDAWLGTASARPYVEDRPADTPWPFRSQFGKSLRGVYHQFNWRAFHDFGTGAFGDMACHTLNLAFRGAELGAVTAARCVEAAEWNDMTYPARSRVDLVYAARESRARPGRRLPETVIHWHDGRIVPDEPRLRPIMRALDPASIPKGGCVIVGTKGMMASLDPYGVDCLVLMDGEKAPANSKVHEACAESAVAPYLPRVKGTTENINTDMDRENVAEFCDAVKGEGKCFSDADYSTAIMEGMLVGCAAQRLNAELRWDSAARRFDSAAANALVEPYVRAGWEF